MRIARAGFILLLFVVMLVETAFAKESLAPVRVDRAAAVTVAAQTTPPALATDSGQLHVIHKRKYVAVVLSLAGIFSACVIVYIVQRRRRP